MCRYGVDLSVGTASLAKVGEQRSPLMAAFHAARLDYVMAPPISKLMLLQRVRFVGSLLTPVRRSFDHDLNVILPAGSR